MDETSDKFNNIRTFIALPVDSFDNEELDKPEQYQVMKNAIIKTLSDGSVCVVDINQIGDQIQIQNENLPENKILPLQENAMQKVAVQNLKNPSPVQKEKNSRYKCPKCKEEFNKIALYRKHMIWHRSVKKYRCTKCSMGYNVETNLTIHMAMHEEGKPTCPLCKISFQRLASLKSHLMLHQVEELYTCEECGAEFEKEDELLKHQQNHTTNNSESTLVCSYCNVKFDDHKSYKEHISHHIKIKKMVLSGKKPRKLHGTKEYPHVCSVCLKSFSRVSLLERHLRVHSGERPFICPHCNRGFNQKGTLQIHLSKHTGIKPFHCTLCSAKFNQKGNLRVHVEKTHTAPMPGVKMFKCSHCACLFKKISSLNVHITKTHGAIEDVGTISDVMSRLKELEKHTTRTATKDVTEENKKITNDGNIVNDSLNTTYVNLAESFLDGTVRQYLVIQKKIDDVKLYVCIYCNKEFKKPSDLIRHTRVHTREKPFVCKQCGASFSLKSTLFCHTKIHSSNNTYSCSVCTKKFTSMRSLNLHLRRHSNQKTYKCITCCETFTTLQQANRHNDEVHFSAEKNSPTGITKQPLLQTINGLEPITPLKQNVDNVKQFKCSTCHLKFTKMRNLSRHMVIHSGEKKFKCDQCSKSYFTYHALKEHLVYHSGVKNFSCKMCGKKYATSSLLRRHTISHNLSKPYVCPHCYKNFKSLTLCKRHINTHKKYTNLQIEDEARDFDGEAKLLQNIKTSSTSKVSTNSFRDEPQNHNEEKCSMFHKNIATNFQEGIENANNTYISDVQCTMLQQLDQTLPVLTNIDKPLERDMNSVHTIFIDCNDVHFTNNNSNGRNSLSDAGLFPPLTDLHDVNVFSVEFFNDSINTNTVALYDNNQIFNLNQDITGENVDLNSETDIAVLKSSVSSNLLQCYKPKKDKSIIVTNSETSVDHNLSFYTHSQLNLFSDEAELATNNCTLNLPEVSGEGGLPGVILEEPYDVQDTGKKTFSRDNCTKGSVDQNDFPKNIESDPYLKKNTVKLHSCSFCSKNFKKQSDLVRHIRTHTGEKPFDCDKCDKRFSLKSTLMSHQRTHNPVSHKRYNCIVCNSFFTSKSSLKVHMSVHTGDKTHECNFCSMKFRTAAHRKSHETSHHMNPMKKKKNKITNLLASVALGSTNQQSLITFPDDETVVHDDLENILVVQDPLSLTDEQLNLLEETNPNNTSTDSNHLEPIIVQNLQSNFLLTDNLISSSVVHLDVGSILSVQSEETQQLCQDGNGVSTEKPKRFQCEHCGKKYASKDVLRRHKKSHGVNKKFPCSKCDKGFDSEAEWEKHDKTHVGFRPYSCMYCSNSFSKEHFLTTHMKRIHNILLKDK